MRVTEIMAERQTQAREIRAEKGMSLPETHLYLTTSKRHNFALECLTCLKISSNFYIATSMALWDFIILKLECCDRCLDYILLLYCVSGSLATG